jgi:diguanylate cyclase (GGDEF)-like protein
MVGIYSQLKRYDYIDMPFNEFRIQAERFPLQNFIPFLQAMERDGRLIPYPKQIKHMLRYLSETISPPGIVKSRAEIVAEENRKKLTARRCEGETLCTLSRVPVFEVKGDKDDSTVLYYRLEHQVKVLDETFIIPSFERISHDRVTELIKTEEYGDRILTDMVRLAEQPSLKNRIALVFLDLNGLGDVNFFMDGHLAGDAYLRTFSRLTRETLRTGDAMFRYAGDEFIVMLVDINPKDVNPALQRLSNKIFEDPRMLHLFEKEKRAISDLLPRIAATKSIEELFMTAAEHKGLMEAVFQMNVDTISQRIAKSIRDRNSKSPDIQARIPENITWDNLTREVQSSTELRSTFNSILTQQLQAFTDSFQVLKTSADEFLQRNFDRVSKSRPGVSIGSVILDQPISREAAVMAADKQSNESKAEFRWVTMGPDAFRAKGKYPDPPNASQLRYNPNARPLVSQSIPASSLIQN